MGFFAGLNTEKYDRQYSDNQLIGRIIDYLNYRAGFYMGFDSGGVDRDNCRGFAGDRQPNC